MNVAVIGAGYVGLTTGVVLAYLGYHVTCVDIDAAKIKLLKKGVLPIFEPGLEILMHVVQERVSFTTVYKDALPQAEVVFLAVGTPTNPDGSPDLTSLNTALNQVLVQLKGKVTPTILVTKSTVPIGTADHMRQRVQAARLRGQVYVLSNPEFLRQGRAVHDTLYPNHIVVGGEEVAVKHLREIYKPIVDQSFDAPSFAPRPVGLTRVPFIEVDLRSAELAKYASNAFLATKISFINEIANFCDVVGADIAKVVEIIGADPRIGPHFLQAGIGYGGSCFPKDTRALYYIAKTNNYDFKLLPAVIDVNNAQKYRILDKLREALGNLQGKQITVLGLTFKPGTDDLRNAPAIPIISKLVEAGAEVHIHDPVAVEKARSLLPGCVKLYHNILDALLGADAVLLLTEWDEYLRISPETFKQVMNCPIIVDGRGKMNMKSFSEAGFVYLAIGRPLRHSNAFK